MAFLDFQGLKSLLVDEEKISAFWNSIDNLS